MNFRPVPKDYSIQPKHLYISEVLLGLFGKEEVESFARVLVENLRRKGGNWSAVPLMEVKAAIQKEFSEESDRYLDRVLEHAKKRKDLFRISRKYIFVSQTFVDLYHERFPDVVKIAG